MRVFNRGATVSFTHTFYDSSGDVTSPSSASLHIAYPTTDYPLRRPDMETTTVTLTQNSTTLAYEGAWASGAVQAGRGTCFYHIRSDDLTLAVEDGRFELRGNPANFAVTSTT